MKSTEFFRRSVLALAALVLLAPVARAHVTLDVPQAVTGESFKAIFRIGHGCDGKATQALTVRVPAGFHQAKPMPKAGWQVDVRRAPLATPFESRGTTIREDVVEVTWRATTRDSWLRDDEYDEFTLRGQVAAQPGVVWFTASQQCDGVRMEWSEVPASGADAHGLKAPAVPLKVLPSIDDPHAGHH
jgi:uncharacterized protein YcnI